MDLVRDKGLLKVDWPGMVSRNRWPFWGQPCKYSSFVVKMRRWAIYASQSLPEKPDRSVTPTARDNNNEVWLTKLCSNRQTPPRGAISISSFWYKDALIASEGCKLCISHVANKSPVQSTDVATLLGLVAKINVRMNRKNVGQNLETIISTSHKVWQISHKISNFAVPDNHKHRCNSSVRATITSHPNQAILNTSQFASTLDPP